MSKKAEKVVAWVNEALRGYPIREPVIEAVSAALSSAEADKARLEGELEKLHKIEAMMEAGGLGTWEEAIQAVTRIHDLEEENRQLREAVARWEHRHHLICRYAQAGANNHLQNAIWGTDELLEHYDDAVHSLSLPTPVASDTEEGHV